MPNCSAACIYFLKLVNPDSLYVLGEILVISLPRFALVILVSPLSFNDSNTSIRTWNLWTVSLVRHSQRFSWSEEYGTPTYGFTLDGILITGLMGEFSAYGGG